MRTLRSSRAICPCTRSNTVCRSCNSARRPRPTAPTALQSVGKTASTHQLRCAIPGISSHQRGRQPPTRGSTPTPDSLPLVLSRIGQSPPFWPPALLVPLSERRLSHYNYSPSTDLLHLNKVLSATLRAKKHLIVCTPGTQHL